jgi:uncharacterized protein
MTAPDFNDSRLAHGIQLFNDGEFFECHDVLEEYWSDLYCSERTLFQGLIQAAVALFHFEEGNRGGALRMYRSCRVYLSPFAPQTAGIDVSSLVAELDACFSELSERCHSSPDDVQLNRDLIPKIRFQPPEDEQPLV